MQLCLREHPRDPGQQGELTLPQGLEKNNPKGARTRTQSPRSGEGVPAGVSEILSEEQPSISSLQYERGPRLESTGKVSEVGHSRMLGVFEEKDGQGSRVAWSSVEPFGRPQCFWNEADSEECTVVCVSRLGSVRAEHEVRSA
jgi:hypothetical protein